MSFADLVKNACSKAAGEEGSVSFRATLDQYMISEAREPRGDMDWNGIEVWHPSSISKDQFCPRQAWLRRTLPKDAPGKRRPPVSPELFRVFGVGTQIHSFYQTKALGPRQMLYGRWLDVSTLADFLQGGELRIETGYAPKSRWLIPGAVERWIYLEPAVYIDELNIGGHCDGLFMWEEPEGRKKVPTILEIKSMRSEVYRRVKASGEPVKYHVTQSSVYASGRLGYVSVRRNGKWYPHGWLWDEDVPEGGIEWRFVPFDSPFDRADQVLLLCHNKNDQEEQVFLYPPAKGAVQKVMQKVAKASMAVLEGKAPGRLNACKTADSAHAKKCSTCEACFSAHYVKSALANSSGESR